ncbi:hypothetical protein [Streptomyces sp. NPDC046939]|uniref:hypothetical protein n=1 Tax=Streptomyces sp. NPDC046939 TaxID=3155376 RepID=UPI0033C81013
MAPSLTHAHATLTDTARIHWVRTENATHRTQGTPPVILLHGGPGLPNYLTDVAALLNTRNGRGA